MKSLAHTFSHSHNKTEISSTKTHSFDEHDPSNNNTSSIPLAMAKRLPLLLALCAAASPSLLHVAFAQTTTCSDGSTGYDTVEALNNDIQSSGSSNQIQVYTICPATSILMNEPLEPLQNSVFRCGSSGLSSDRCQFTGGANQVLLNANGVDVRFQGITFAGFTGSAVSGSATSSSKVTMEDSIFAVSMDLRGSCVHATFEQPNG